MKKWIKKLVGAVGALALACSSAFGSVAINATNFPDASFRSYISSNFDKNSDGTLSDAEIAKATNIYVLSTMKLTGIEKLTALKVLACKFSLAGNKFNYTTFKSTYGLTCDIDDSYLLLIYTLTYTGIKEYRTGLTTPMVGDVRDTSTDDYILQIPFYTDREVRGIEFRTKGTLAITVNVWK